MLSTDNEYHALRELKSRAYQPISGQAPWNSCPRYLSKPLKCTLLKDQVFHEKSIDQRNGEEKAVLYNMGLAFTFSQAVNGCKHACSGSCKSFNIKKRDNGRGYSCTYFSSVIDPKKCEGAYNPGAETTYMKYEYGMCEQFANKNNTKTCCDEQ